MVSCALVICVRGHYYTFIGAVNFHILETETETKNSECALLFLSSQETIETIFVNPLDPRMIDFAGYFLLNVEASGNCLCFC